MKEVIVVVMMEGMTSGINRPATLTFTIVDNVLMVMAEVDIGLRPAPIYPIIQVGLAYC